MADMIICSVPPIWGTDSVADLAPAHSWRVYFEPWDQRRTESREPLEIVQNVIRLVPNLAVLSGRLFVSQARSPERVERYSHYFSFGSSHKIYVLANLPIFENQEYVEMVGLLRCHPAQGEATSSGIFTASDFQAFWLSPGPELGILRNVTEIPSWGHTDASQGTIFAHLTHVTLEH